jgi:hypothetical protein
VNGYSKNSKTIKSLPVDIAGGVFRFRSREVTRSDAVSVKVGHLVVPSRAFTACDGICRCMGVFSHPHPMRADLSNP